ncbi:MAG TPA: hypothetical protein VGD55_06280, partial [Acidothermaceae bacterium]
HRVLLERRNLKDGRDDGPCPRVGSLTGVDRAGLKLTLRLKLRLLGMICHDVEAIPKPLS